MASCPLSRSWELADAARPGDEVEVHRSRFLRQEHAGLQQVPGLVLLLALLLFFMPGAPSLLVPAAPFFDFFFVLAFFLLEHRVLVHALFLILGPLDPGAVVGALLGLLVDQAGLEQLVP